jgi:hypothetical protein
MWQDKEGAANGQIDKKTIDKWAVDNIHGFTFNSILVVLFISLWRKKRRLLIMKIESVTAGQYHK